MVVTLSGENSFALKQSLSSLVNEFINKYGDLAVEQIDAEEIDSARVAEAITSLPFLFDKKLVIIKEPSKDKEIADSLLENLEKIPDTTDLIIVESKPDKRLSLYKTLKARTDFREFNVKDQPTLAKWLVEYISSNGGHLSLGDANYLISRVGTNQELLKNEADKLILYDKTVTLANIDLLTEASVQSTIFQLIEAAFNGNQSKTINLYREQRELQVDPQQIMAMLSWQLHGLALIKAAKDKSLEVIAQETKQNPYVLRKNQSIARDVSLNDVKTYIDDLAELDIRLKTKSIDPDEALELYLLNITNV